MSLVFSLRIMGTCLNFLSNLHRSIYEHITPLFLNFYLFLLYVKAHTCEGQKTTFGMPVLSCIYVVASRD